jgi:serine/threonine-protein kinase
MVKVPDVTGDTTAAATKALKNAGFTVTQKTQTVTDPTQDKLVISESPKGGGQAKQGSAVTIVVGKYQAQTTTTTTPTTTTTTTPTTTTTSPG